MSDFWWSGNSDTWNAYPRTWLNGAYPAYATFAMVSDTPKKHNEHWDTQASQTWDDVDSLQEYWGNYVPLARSGTATFAHDVGATVPTVGFALAGDAVMNMSMGQTNVGNTIYISEITLGVTQDTSSVGNIVFVEAITFENVVNIPLAGTTTWNLETATWSSATGSFGYAPPVRLNVTAEITQVMLNKLNAEDIQKIADGLMPTNLGVGATVTLVMPFSGTLSNEQSIKNNVNFEESAILVATSGTSSSSNFLWNDIAEDTGSTWTKVSDPDE